MSLDGYAACMDKQPTEKKRLLLRVADAAEMLSIARSKAYAMVQAGDLPSVRIGASVRVPAGAVEEYVARLVREATGGRAA